MITAYVVADYDTEILQKLQAFENVLVLNLLSLKLAVVTKATHFKGGELWKTTANAFAFNCKEYARDFIWNINLSAHQWDIEGFTEDYFLTLPFFVILGFVTSVEFSHWC